jgi:hypothetical protein
VTLGRSAENVRSGARGAWTEQIDRWFAAPGTVLTHAGLPNEGSRSRHEEAWPQVLVLLDERIAEPPAV